MRFFTALLAFVIVAVAGIAMACPQCQRAGVPCPHAQAVPPVQAAREVPVRKVQVPRTVTEYEPRMVPVHRTVMEERLVVDAPLALGCAAGAKRDTRFFAGARNRREDRRDARAVHGRRGAGGCSGCAGVIGTVSYAPVDPGCAGGGGQQPAPDNGGDIPNPFLPPAQQQQAPAPGLNGY